MARVIQLPDDAYRARRQQLLADVLARLREAGIAVSFEPLERYYDFCGYPRYAPDAARS